MLPTAPACPMYAAFTATAEKGCGGTTNPNSQLSTARRVLKRCRQLHWQAGTNPGLRASIGPMTDNQTPFANLSLERAIGLRWALRDIKAKRLKLSPVNQGDLATLTELGLIEMREDVPVLTQAGHNALDG